MSDLSRYVELYRQTTEHDTEVLWKKVEIIRTAIEDGADVETLLTECGKESGDSARQVRKFYAVARVFAPDMIRPDFDYWTYQVAATAPGVDPEDMHSHEIAWDWMDKAGHRQIKRGKKTIHAKHTARTLKAAIRAASGDAKPKAETVLKWDAKYRGAKVIGDTQAEVLFIVPHDIRTWKNLNFNETYQLTITRVPSPATAPKAEAESEVAV